MSGIRGNCIVCNKFFATGHLGGDPYWSFKSDLAPEGLFFVCTACAPYLPKYQLLECACGAKVPGYVHHPETYAGKYGNNEVVCQGCKDYKKHEEARREMSILVKECLLDISKQEAKNTI